MRVIFGTLTFLQILSKLFHRVQGLFSIPRPPLTDGMATTLFTSLLQGAQFLADSPIPGSDFLPGSGNLFPKWPEKLSPTATESWLFDAMAEDGSAAFTVTFFREGAEAPNSFRAAINAVWADGTVWSRHLVVP